MILESLSLRYFKGIKEFTLTTNGGNISIFADNAVGKTSIADAFSYLLFGKDSKGAADFEIKTLGPDGEALHHLNHECEAQLRHNGKLITLRRVYAEKWTKKRGSATEAFSGHESTFYIDGIPSSKREYEDFIAGVINEDIFRLLTSPTYFNALHWEKRRKLLLEICGDLTDEEVISSDEALAKLPEILGGRTIDDHRKVIAARKTKINAELKELPARIDEVTRNLPDVTDFNENLLIVEIEGIKAKLQEKRNELSRIQSGGEIAEKTKALRQIESRMLEIQNQHNAEALSKTQAKRAELGKVRGNIAMIEQDVQQKQNRIKVNDVEITKLEARIADLLNKWHEANKSQFDGENVCPTCGRDLPEEQVKDALAKFNLDKSEKLAGINADGKHCRAEIEKLKQANEEYVKQIADMNGSYVALNDTAAALQKEIDRTDNPDLPPEYLITKAEKEALQAEIATLTADNSELVANAKEEIVATEAELTAAEKKIHQIDTHAAGQKRIDELKKQEKALAKEFEELESQLYLTDQFIKTKVDMMTEKINSKFKLARFKMFEFQVNGAVNDQMCDTTYNGVPYSDLNSAARVQIGLDIIATLQEHFGFKAPVWIDNRESIVKLPDMDCQVISLIVSEKDKSLRVECEPEKLKEAV